jgi:hypothetical protein
MDKGNIQVCIHVYLDVMFGNDIVQQACSENAVVPHVVLKCVREVEFRGSKYISKGLNNSYINNNLK